MKTLKFITISLSGSVSIIEFIMGIYLLANRNNSDYAFVFLRALMPTGEFTSFAVLLLLLAFSCFVTTFTVLSDKKYGFYLGILPFAVSLFAAILFTIYSKGFPVMFGICFLLGILLGADIALCIIYFLRNKKLLAAAKSLTEESDANNHEDINVQLKETSVDENGEQWVKIEKIDEGKSKE